MFYCNLIDTYSHYITAAMFSLVSASVCLVTKVTSVKRNARCHSMVATVQKCVNVHMVTVILSQENVQDVTQVGFQCETCLFPW